MNKYFFSSLLTCLALIGCFESKKPAQFYVISGGKHDQIHVIDRGFLNDVDDSYIEILNGKWLKLTSARDTLAFNLTKEMKPHFVLTIQNGHRPWGKPEGIYDFGVKADSIQVWWSAQNTLGIPPKYYFHVDKKNKLMVIGNFYAAKDEQTLLMFKKL